MPVSAFGGGGDNYSLLTTALYKEGDSNIEVVLPSNSVDGVGCARCGRSRLAVLCSSKAHHTAPHSSVGSCPCKSNAAASLWHECLRLWCEGVGNSSSSSSSSHPGWCCVVSVQHVSDASVPRLALPGVVWRYVRASMSIAMLVPPLPDPVDGHLLVDGCYINNVPGKVGQRDAVL
ncbi:Neuropathy target esterase sws [Portunus trituberculatus]|uniref:Neuropathy target esterase sws n=1 Tax=Portunus trituberculatus TaxID=210409 RepID=A0A5B7DU81_PORTR|nr:Neuropathy target esterase sws [Portunus trituberculatus]